MKYLGIVIDNKFKFSEHISYAAERTSKLIHSLSKLAKLTWGLHHEALQTVYYYDTTSPTLRCPGMGRDYEV
jgi:hypothetical protein